MVKKPTSGAEASMAEGAEPEKVRTSAGNRGQGRKKGVPNKNTTALKDAILNAFHKAGGEDYLVKLSQSDPKTFAMLLGKVLPLQIKGDPDQPMRLEITWAE